MPGTTREWPAWPEFTKPGVDEAKDPEFLSIKKAVIAEYGAEVLRQSWIKVCRDLEAVTDEIAAKGSSIVPSFETTQILSKGFTDSQRSDAQRIGAFVCKATIPQPEAETLYKNVATYISDNKHSIQSWPVESPSMFILYNSPAQNTIRSHPNHIALQRRLNELWHNYDDEDTSSEPLAFFDGIRDRAPGQPFLGLGPHIDAGSLCRWADPNYRKVYDNIFRGNPEVHDPYDIRKRKDANQDVYKGVAHSTVLRTFQGWTALTPTQAREGTIMVYPNVKTAVAYMLLRPFFQPPQGDNADVMNPEAWTLDGESGWFPGTFKPQSQRLSRASHPHLRLEECLVHMPKVNPGDTVWWHCDVSLLLSHSGGTSIPESSLT